jgi:hypothetical protein
MSGLRHCLKWTFKYLVLWGVLFLACGTVLWAETCSYTYHCTRTGCADMMGGWSGTKSQSGVTFDQCEAARKSAIPTGSSTCTCTSDGSTPSGNPNGSTPMAQGHNLQQNMVSYGANLMISNIQNSTTRAFMNGFTNAFLQNVFDSQAEAQRQQEIIRQQIEARRRQEAEQRRIAEQQRIDAMFARLGKQLKLEGLPFDLTPKPVTVDTNLELKPMNSSGPESLSLKLSNSTPASYGLKGLPGIYVGGPAASSDHASAQGNSGDSSSPPAGNSNLASGPGSGTTGPGIPGLPGIYLDRIQPDQAPQVAQAATHLIGADQVLAQDAALQAAQQNPALTGPTQDPKIQAFQQNAQQYSGAVAAEETAERQWKDAQSRAEADQAALTLAHTKLDTANQTAAQQAAMNKMLSEANSDEKAAEAARKIFEGTQAHVALTRAQAAGALATLAPSPVSAPNHTSVVDLSHSTQPAPALLRTSSPILGTAPGRPMVASAALQTAVAATSAPRPAIPQLCSRLSGAQNALRRLMETQKMQNENREEWEKTVDAASDDALKRGLDMTREVMGGAFQDSVKNLINKDDAEIEKLYRDISAERDPLKAGAMQKRWQELDLNKANLEDALQRSEKYYKHLDELAGERDLHDWAKEGKTDLPSFMEGVRQLADHLLADGRVKEALHLSPDGADYIKYSASIIDSGYDIYSEWLASDQIKQLNRNADQYLRAVAELQARIRQTVNQLNRYKAENPTGAPCADN